MPKLDISIKNPCSENWDNFEKKGNTGFCASCEKHVIDFTKYTDREIIEFFKKNNGRTCGRFKEDQLKVYKVDETRSPFNKIAAVLTAGVLTITQAPDAFAQHKLVIGKVVDEANLGVPGTNVLIKGVDEGTVTDADGSFTIDYSGEQKELTLIFSFIGYKTIEKTIAVPEDRANIGNVPLAIDEKALGEVVVVAGYVCARRSNSLWHRLGSIFRR